MSAGRAGEEEHLPASRGEGQQADGVAARRGCGWKDGCGYYFNWCHLESCVNFFI